MLQLLLLLSLTTAASAANVPTLTATPPIVNDFGSVSITWNTPTFQPVTGDYITYSCGPTQNLLDEIDRCTLNLTSTTQTTPTPTPSPTPTLVGGHPPLPLPNRCVFLSLVNLRCDYTFTYVRQKTALASITVPVAQGNSAPAQGHLAFGDTIDAMYVSWVSGSNQTQSKVQYGTASQKYTHATATFDTTTYTAEQVCNSPANTTSQSYWRDPGYFHHVLLTHLLPHTRYFYTYGNANDGWSEERSFLSRPLPGTVSAQEVKFLGYGDQDWDEPGSVQTAALALRDVTSKGFDNFVLHFGDLAYGEGDVSDWDHWATQVEPYASRAPYMVSYGNHEYNYVHGKWKDQTLRPMRRPSQSFNRNTTTTASTSQDDGPSFSPPGCTFGSDSKGECGIALVHRFRGPSNGRANGKGSMAWYSFEWGKFLCRYCFNRICYQLCRGHTSERY